MMTGASLLATNIIVAVAWISMEQNTHIQASLI